MLTWGKKRLRTPLYRDRKLFNAETFCEVQYHSLGEIVRNNLPLNFENFNQTFNLFTPKIAELIDKHAPLKRMSLKQMKLAKKNLEYKRNFSLHT